MAAASEGSVSASMLTKSRNSPVKRASVMGSTPPVASTGVSETATELDSATLVVVTRASTAAGARWCTRWPGGSVTSGHRHAGRGSARTVDTPGSEWLPRRAARTRSALPPARPHPSRLAAGRRGSDPMDSGGSVGRRRCGSAAAGARRHGRNCCIWSTGLAQHCQPLWGTAPTRTVGLPVGWAFEADCAHGDFIGSRIAAADRAAQAPDIGQRACGGRIGWLEQDGTGGGPAIGSGSADRPTAWQAGDLGHEQPLAPWRGIGRRRNVDRLR